MKKSIAQSIGLLVLIGIAFVAGSVKAGNPATAPGAAFPNGNTPFPITVSSAMQIKGAGAPPASGGGLAVREFSVWQNASFDKEVGIQGILMGKTTSGNTSALSFGTTGNTVDVTTTGTTYTNGSMYAASLTADAGQLGLCANKAGEIVTCGTVVTAPQTVVTGTLRGTSHTMTLTLAQPTTAAVTFPNIQSTFSESVDSGQGGPTTIASVSYTYSITVPAGRTSGTATPSGSGVYECTVPTTRPASEYVYLNGGIKYVLQIDRMCP